MRWSAHHIAAGLALAAAAGLLSCPLLPASENRALALSVGAIGLWATGAIPEYLTALIFFTLAMLFKIQPPGVIFGGFESAAWWLIFGGLVMGIAVKSTGLGERIAHRLARGFGNSYWGVITGVTVVGVTLGFVMPSSMGRAVLLMPIALSLADRFGFACGSKGRTGVVLAAAFGCHVPTFSVLPANVPNMVLVGAAEQAYHYVPTYGTYLLLHFPVLGFLKTAVMVPLIVWLYPDRPRPSPGDGRHGNERRRKGIGDPADRRAGPVDDRFDPPHQPGLGQHDGGADFAGAGHRTGRPQGIQRADQLWVAVFRRRHHGIGSAGRQIRAGQPFGRRDPSDPAPKPGIPGDQFRLSLGGQHGGRPGHHPTGGAGGADAAGRRDGAGVGIVGRDGSDEPGPGFFQSPAAL